jgi:hypothetical protein
MTPSVRADRPRLQTVDGLLQLVYRSGLVETGRLEDFLRTQKLSPESVAAAEQLVEAGLLTSFQAELLLRGKWRGFHVGNYRVLEPLARGGMGRVYLCEHTTMHRRAVIKVLSTALSGDASAVARFQREMRAAAALDHPNIVRAYDAGSGDTFLYLVMEYLEGITLGAMVRRHGPLSLPLAVASVRQVALGLQYAHDSGWIHRDIKPDNLLMTPQGVVKILDLGLARLLRSDSDPLTQKYAMRDILGTADYMAPEQIQPGGEVDGRTDIYGLGGTFYCLLTGEPPLGTGSVAQKLLGHLIGDIPSVQVLRPEVPDGVDRVLRRMLARAPDQRYADPGAVIAALDTCLQHDERIAVSPLFRPKPARDDRTPIAKPRRLIRWRRTAIVVGVVAIVTLLTAGAVGAAMWWKRAAVAPTMTRPPEAPCSVVAPADASKHVLESVEVEMTVESSAMSRSQTTVFLNSRPNYRDEANFTVVLARSVLLECEKEGIGDPVVYFRGKRIHVHGTITLFDNRPQIAVSSLKEIRIVEDE